MNMQNRDVLVTGDAGLIGSALARRLVAMDANVTLVDSLIPEYGGNLRNLHDIKDNVRLNISDVRDAHAMKYLVRDVDVVFNLAGQTSHMDGMADPFTDMEINARAQLSILEALRHHNPRAKVGFASTRQIYGKPDYLPVDGEHPKRPVDLNGINKIAGEDYHLLYGRIYGIPSCALRLTNTYGPGMRIKDARQTFVGIWIRRMLDGKPFDVWGGDQLRDFNYSMMSLKPSCQLPPVPVPMAKHSILARRRCGRLLNLQTFWSALKRGRLTRVTLFPTTEKKTISEIITRITKKYAIPSIGSQKSPWLTDLPER